MNNIPPCKGECDYGTCNTSSKDTCNLNCACLKCNFSTCKPAENNRLNNGQVPETDDGDGL